jgi:hypothetical protein
VDQEGQAEAAITQGREMSKNRMLRIARDFGPFTASASYQFNKDSGEWDKIDSLIIESRGKSGSEISEHLDAIGNWFSRCAQGRELK